MVKRIAPLFMFVFALGACDAILQIPDRRLDSHVACSGGTCQCAAGFMSCDGKDDNGCETDISQPNNCGGCGVTCSNAACVDNQCQCNTGYQDCDGVAANGCEAFTVSDVENCGVCGHSCVGGECMGGVCQAVVLAKGVGPLDMALGPDHVYFTTIDGLSRVPKRGGAVEVLAADKTANLLTTGPDAVYWSITNQVQVTRFDMSKPTALFADKVTPDGRMAICGAAVCWLETSNAMPPVSRMVRAPLAGGAVTGIPVNAYDLGLVSDAKRAYWVTSAMEIVAMDHDKAKVDKIGTVMIAYDLAVNTSSIFWDDNDGVNAMPLAGGKPSVIATTMLADKLAADDSDLYYSDLTNSSIVRVTLSTGESKVIYPGGIDYIEVIAVDEKAVYWASDNDIVAIAR